MKKILNLINLNPRFKKSSKMINTKLSKQILKTNDNYIKSLEKINILSIGDFLNIFPRDFDDRTNVIDSFSKIDLTKKNTILVKLISINSKKTSNNKLLSKAILQDKNEFLCEAVFFNRKYLANQLEKFIQKKIIINGKAKYDFGKISFLSPEIETDLSKVSGEIVPIYPDINYIPGKWIEVKMKLLKNFISKIEEDLPNEIIKKYDFISKKEAIEKLHFPKNKLDIEISRYRLGYGELFEINYKSIKKKYDGFSISNGNAYQINLDTSLVKEIIKLLPFNLGDKQKIALFQILKDMEKNHAMSRLLEGDVGTGKTIVAIVAAIHTLLKKKFIQVAFMAPSEILARQHFLGSKNILSKYNIKSSLLLGATKEKGMIKQDLENGDLDIIFGTHSLLQKDVIFNNLGFVIIDEQHKFGVKQRSILENYISIPEKDLSNKSGKINKIRKNVLMPHVLNMTATPIPRTLALTIYGDQDLSIIDEYPKYRKEIITKLIKNKEERYEVELFIKEEILKGRQVFWISPLVEESEKIDLANAVNTYENLKDIFHPFEVGLLHGKIKSKQKEEIMNNFLENKIQILSSTSVIEVGIDVPNATIICIESAERFGLSQLHQFRGRVGRGDKQSYCYLFSTKSESTTRLRAMEKTNNGFELSQIDLEIRGPGEVYGIKQSGIPDLKIASLKDLGLISQIREDIENMFNDN